MKTKKNKNKNIIKRAFELHRDGILTYAEYEKMLEYAEGAPNSEVEYKIQPPKGFVESVDPSRRLAETMAHNIMNLEPNIFNHIKLEF